MAFWKDMATSVAGGFAGPIGGAAAGMLIDKVQGVPSPGKTGTALGQDARRAQEAQYPGTNPWERLGAPGYAGSGVEVAKQTGRMQRQLQTRELATKLQVAKIGASAHVEAARTTSAPAKLKAPAEKKQTEAVTRLTLAKTLTEGKELEIKTAVGQFAARRENAKLTKEKWDNVGSGIVNLGNEMAKEKASTGETSAVAYKMGLGTAVGLIAAAAAKKFMVLWRAAWPGATKVIQRAKVPPGGPPLSATTKVKTIYRGKARNRDGNKKR